MIEKAENSDCVTLASSDYEAAAQVVRLEFDAVVLDMRSPALRCQALCRWLCASLEGKGLPVLAVGSLEDQNAARAAGADAYLPRTAIADRLQAELEALLT